MKIPVRNVYYLLCYAWNRVEEGRTVDLGSEDFDAPIDLFAKVLNIGVSRLITRGLDRDYLSVHEDIRGIKGKLDLGTTVKRTLLPNGMAHCSFDELSYDVPQNRILKATLRNLTQVGALDDEQQRLSDHLYRKLSAVSNVRLDTKMFHTIRIHRNNRFYRFLLHICHIIHDNLHISEAKGTTQFLDFRLDEKKMGLVFEDFVRNFCRRKTSYEVSAPRYKWFETNESLNDRECLPEMRTDIVLKSSEHMIIVDTKYHNPPLETTQSGKEKIKSDHLYQIHAYVTNWAARTPSDDPEGWLLYAAVDDQGFNFHYELVGRRFRVCSINLSQDWKDIEKDLLELVGEKNQNGTAAK